MADIVRYPYKQVGLNLVIFTSWIVADSFGFLVPLLGRGWTIGGFFILFYVLGAFYARAAALLIHCRWQRISNKLGGDKFFMTLWRVIAWPWAAVFDYYAKGSGTRRRQPFWWISDWFSAPVRKNEAEAQKLLDRATALREAASLPNVTPEDARLLRSASKELMQQARDMKNVD